VATIPAELLTAPGTLPVAVLTPGPSGPIGVAYTLSSCRPSPAATSCSPPTAGRAGTTSTAGSAGGTARPLEEANSQTGSDGYPTISADGRFIAFQSDGIAARPISWCSTGRRAPWTRCPRPITRRLRRLPAHQRRRAFVVFESDRLSRRPKLFLFDRQGRTLTELIEANDPAADDAWAPSATSFRDSRIRPANPENSMNLLLSAIPDGVHPVEAP